jgi:hypothetical protein
MRLLNLLRVRILAVSEVNREVYFWIVLIIIVLAAALWFRFFYTQPLQVATSFNQSGSSNLSSVYPYQQVSLDVNIANTGTAELSDVGVGVIINGNVSYVYGVTLSPGREGEILYNYTPPRSGTYNVTFVVDPNRLYNIADRNKTKTVVLFKVDTPQNATPYEYLPVGNTSYKGAYNFRSEGELLSYYIASTYNLSDFNLSTMPALNNFMVPILDLVSVSEKITKISEAYAYYPNYTVSSIWITGYISPSIFAIAAQGRSFATKNLSLMGTQLTTVNITKNVSLCSWYSGGWIKTLTVEGNLTCTGLLESHAPLLSTPIAYMINKDVTLSGNDVIANYTRLGITGNSVGELESVNGSLLYAEVATNATPAVLCYGEIETVSGINYCSAYVYPVGWTKANFPNVSMIQTRAYIGSNELSALSVTNTSAAGYLFSNSISDNVGALQKFGISGNSIAFQSAIRNSCSLRSFNCSNVTFAQSNLTFTLTNTNKNASLLKNIACTVNGNPPALTLLNRSLAFNQSITITAGCYDNGNTITGLFVGLQLHLKLNFTTGASNALETDLGAATLASA